MNRQKDRAGAAARKRKGKNMFFRKRKSPPLTPPPGLGAKDIATESSICTGETVIGFRDPAGGRLLQAVVVRSPADREAFYRAYGWEPPRGQD